MAKPIDSFNVPGWLKEKYLEDYPILGQEIPEQKPGESDLDYRARAEPFITAYTQAGGTSSPAFVTQRMEDKALLEEQAERRARTRRRLGPSGYGNTILTSPLGPSGAAPGQMRTLLGSA